MSLAASLPAYYDRASTSGWRESAPRLRPGPWNLPSFNILRRV